MQKTKTEDLSGAPRRVLAVAERLHHRLCGSRWMRADANYLREALQLSTFPRCRWGGWTTTTSLN